MKPHMVCFGQLIENLKNRMQLAKCATAMKKTSSSFIPFLIGIFIVEILFCLLHIFSCQFFHFGLNGFGFCDSVLGYAKNCIKHFKHFVFVNKFYYRIIKCFSIMNLDVQFECLIFRLQQRYVRTIE